MGGSIEESIEHFGSGAAGVKLRERSLREDVEGLEGGRGGGRGEVEDMRRMGVEGGMLMFLGHFCVFPC